MANSFIDLYPQYEVKKQDNPACLNPFVKNHLNSVTNYKKLNNDLNRIQKGVDVFIKSVNSAEKRLSSNPLQMFFTGLLNIIPGARRLSPIEDNEKQHNLSKAVGLGLLAVINLKEDLRDMLSIFGLSKSNAPKGYYAKFKFFAGTFTEKWLERREWGQDFIDSWDKSIADTQIGSKLYQHLDIKEDLQFCKKETKFPFVGKEVIYRPYIQTESKFLPKLAWLTMNRITKIGLVFMSLIELPLIYKEVKNKKYSQIPKSALSVLSCSFCGGLFSALLSLIGIPSGSVIGLGIGLLIGNNVSKSLYEKK